MGIYLLSFIKRNSTLLKYAVVNGILTFAYFALYYAFIEVFGMNYLLSNVVSYVVAVIVAYILTKYYVFASDGGGLSFALFVGLRIIMVFASSLGIWFLTEKLFFNKYISFIVVNGICFLASYILNKWIFCGAGRERS